MPDWVLITIGFIFVSIVYYYIGKLVIKTSSFIWNKLFNKKKEK